MSLTDVVLSVAASLSPLGAVVMGILYHRQNKRRKDLENEQIELDNRKTEHQILLDDTTRSRLIEEAATVNEEREQRREEWWGSQISMLRSEIEAERTLSNRRFKRLNQLESWATQHVVWDLKAWNKIREIDPHFEPPPSLPDEVFPAVIHSPRLGIEGL